MNRTATPGVQRWCVPWLGHSSHLEYQFPHFDVHCNVGPIANINDGDPDVPFRDCPPRLVPSLAVSAEVCGVSLAWVVCKATRFAAIACPKEIRGAARQTGSITTAILPLRNVSLPTHTKINVLNQTSSTGIGIEVWLSTLIF